MYHSKHRSKIDVQNRLEFYLGFPPLPVEDPLFSIPDEDDDAGKGDNNNNNDDKIGDDQNDVPPPSTPVALLAASDFDWFKHASPTPSMSAKKMAPRKL